MDYAAEYTKIHEQHPKFFAGMSLKRYVNDLVKIIADHKPARLLDYGCGKGYQYLGARYHERWGGLLPICYDFGVRQLWNRPCCNRPPEEKKACLADDPAHRRKFDGIICTDMMEHVPEEKVAETLDDILSFAAPERMYVLDKFNAFVFFAISCVPDDKPFRLSDGRGVHVTLKDPTWWIAMIEAALERAATRGGPTPTVYYVFDTATGGARGVIE